MESFGSYSLDGQVFNCTKDFPCLTNIDIARGQMTYLTNWVWISLQTVLDDGRRIGLNFGEGIGYQYTDLDKASEDCIWIDGVHYKLDVSRISHSRQDLMAEG